ncbi:MAG TPA: OmpA family protein [Polyangiaceae bacterium]|nr:OmpA family protein [Polyangiaceae bacterium]
MPTRRYDAALADAKKAKDATAACDAAVAKLTAELAEVKAELEQASDLAEQRNESLSQAQLDEQNLRAKLDEATALIEELRSQLERLGKNAGALVAEKGTLATALADAKKRLEELRKAQAAADARAALFRDLALKFHKMIDSGELKVVLRDGRMVIQLANDVLFDSGQTTIKPAGQQALAQVATVLKTIPDRHFQVAGDTDNVPIATSRFASNWELSTARGVEVVRFLVAHGVAPQVLSAAGYGEFDPIAPNDTPAGRAKNRRIEITLQPNIDELVAVPGAS